MLLLLGDELIRDQGIAAFELVKNAYDADASYCHVTLNNPEQPSVTSIVVEDDGSGMTPETVRGVWLEPGTDYRAKQKQSSTRTPKYHRSPLGEKGVGRFAAHKLGDRVVLTTKAAQSDEVVVEIDWTDFAKDAYLDEISVQIHTRPPQVFSEGKTGTKLDISAIRPGEAWTRGKVRDLHRAVASICSPFRGPTDFYARLTLVPTNNWLDGLLTAEQVLEQSLFKATGELHGNLLSYQYDFTPPAGLLNRISPRTSRQTNIPLTSADKKPEALDLSAKRVGRVTFDFHIFDREPSVLALTSDKAGLKRYLDQNGGIRVYRDGVRVFDFGEPSNDWLGLGGRRVNVPAVRISNNQIIGGISLVAPESTGLIEKTNREGFIENEAYAVLRAAVLGAVANVEAERRRDKENLRKFFSHPTHRLPVVDEINELRAELKRQNLEGPLTRSVDRIESQFLSVQETLLTAAGSGLTLSMVIHEVEKGIKTLLQAVKKHAPREKLKDLAEHLDKMVSGLSFLMRKSGKSTERASTLIQQALFNVDFRLKAHRIAVTNTLDKEGGDFEVKCIRRLVVATIMNLIDNSIYWLSAKGSDTKRLLVGTHLDVPGGPCIVVADNGPGFLDPPEYLVQPFFTRRPDGIGLGLHLANEIATLHEGRLLFPSREDLGLPKVYSGAIVAFQFPPRAK